jgi:hypothetical protein
MPARDEAVTQENEQEEASVNPPGSILLGRRLQALRRFMRLLMTAFDRFTHFRFLRETKAEGLSTVKAYVLCPDWRSMKPGRPESKKTASRFRDLLHDQGK